MRHPPAHRGSIAVLIAWIALRASAAAATPLDIIPVGDPLEAELRVLEVSGLPPGLGGFDTRPLRIVDLPALEAPLWGPAEIARRRLLRALARDRGGPDTTRGATPRLVQRTFPEDQRFEISAGIEGGASIAQRHDPDLDSGTGLHLRFGAQVGRWLAHTHAIVGHVVGVAPTAQRFLGSATLHSEETYLSYAGARERWGATVGRGRWQWGPGENGGLLLSRTAPAITGMTLRMRIEPLRADAVILNATLGAAAGEQLAAHRIEWQPLGGLRVGVGEAARYRARQWHLLYLMGALPYAMVQNLLAQDEVDSLQALRNNVLTAFDAAWRIAPGTRVYGEFLVDDLKTDRSPIVSKYAMLLGCEGAGSVRSTRVTWRAEFVRLTRFVYTSFFGESFEAQGEPLGFPTGPDSRFVRVQGTWDPSVDWQAFGSASRTDRGESGLDVPFVPGSPWVPVDSFAGVVETTRDLELGLRYWPAAGIDVAVAAGYRWVDDLDHVPGQDRRQARARLSVRLVR